MAEEPGWKSTVEVRDGSAVLARRAGTPEFRARLMRAADILATIHHPGVEVFVSLDSDAHATTLTTRLAGERTLEQHPPRRGITLAALVAALAQLIADLHESGVTHGPIDARDVILADHDRPVLCEFSSGQTHAELDRRGWEVARGDDVRSLGTLVVHGLGGLPAVRGLGMRERLARQRLRRIAQQVLSGTPPDAAGLARSCERVTASPRPIRDDAREPRAAHTHTRTDRTDPDPFPRGSGSGEGRRRRSRRGDLAPALGIVVGFALCLFGAVGLTSAFHAAGPDRAETASPQHTTGSSTGPTCPRTTGSSTGRRIDVDGDGCPERIRVDGSDLEIAGVHYRIGAPGDLVELGDWDGDGIVTPALVRPSTGAVFVFRSWPAAGDPLTAHPVARVHSVTRLSIRHLRDGRDVLLLTPTSGPTVPLDLDHVDSERTTKP